MGARRVFTVLLVLALVPVGRAAARDLPVADVREMSAAFGRYCLRAFPDTAAVGVAARADGAVALSPAEVAVYLHDDPGDGWRIATATTAYVLTVERPPFRICALRRMTPDGFSTLRPYLDALAGYARGRGGALAVANGQTARMPSGADIQATPYTLVLQTGAPPAETLMVLVTNYHGQYAGPMAEAAQGGEGIEVRFARALERAR